MASKHLLNELEGVQDSALFPFSFSSNVYGVKLLWFRAKRLLPFPTFHIAFYSVLLSFFASPHSLNSRSCFLSKFYYLDISFNVVCAIILVRLYISGQTFPFHGLSNSCECKPKNTTNTLSCCCCFPCCCICCIGCCWVDI